MSQSTIVRARQKAMKDLPEWVMCCEARRERLAETAGKLEIEVFCGLSIQINSGVCGFCSHPFPERKLMKCEPITYFGEEYTTIAVDCFDFDEGPSQAVTHDH